MFRKTIAVGKPERIAMHLCIATESYWMFGILLYRRDVLVPAS